MDAKKLVVPQKITAKLHEITNKKREKPGHDS